MFLIASYSLVVSPFSLDGTTLLLHVKTPTVFCTQFLSIRCFSASAFRLPILTYSPPAILSLAPLRSIPDALLACGLPFRCGGNSLQAWISLPQSLCRPRLKKTSFLFNPCFCLRELWCVLRHSPCRGFPILLLTVHSDNSPISV